MDYKKKYEEALERARQVHTTNVDENKKSTEYIFPELKESEDEKTKRILHSISSKMSFHLRDIFTEEEFQCFDAWSNAMLEKQGKSALEAIKEEKADNANKIEPKFKVGDWVVFENKHQSTYQVEKIEDGYYILRHTHGGTFRICVLHDKSLRLWTIQDAKDGDILASKTTSCVLIFKGRDTSTTFSSYYNTSSDDNDDWSNDNFLPAMKGQRELLFAKMKEHG